MRVVLEFHGDGRATVLLNGESPAEKAILGFLAEGRTQWAAHPTYGYRVSGVEELRLYPSAPPAEKT